MSKIINYNNDFHNRILNGIEKAEKCVGSTLGPSGRPVLLNDGRQTRLTKDGITVFDSIELEDPVENSAVMALREASAKVAKDAGDGTTTVTILGAAIYKNGLKYTTMNANPVQMKSGIDKAANRVIEILKSKSKNISSKEDIKKVCLISSNGDERVSEVISDVFSKLGKDATIQIENSGTEIGYTIVDGFQLQNTGYLSPFFCSDETMTCNFTNAYVLIIDGKLTNVNSIIPTLKFTKEMGLPLLIVADTVESEVLSMLIMNRIRTGLQVCCVKAPSYGEYRKAIYRDIAMLTNGQVVSEETGVSFEDIIRAEQTGSKRVLGVAKTVTVTKDSMTLVGSGDNKDEMDKYVKALRAQIDTVTDELDEKKMIERYSRLTRGVAKINVCAPSEIELKELRDRVDDAFCSAKSAMTYGIVPGGGTSLLIAKKEMAGFCDGLVGDEKIGAKILIDSLEAPIRRILENAGLDASYIVSKIVESENGTDVGYDVVSKKTVNMVESGIIDPTFVECSAVSNAASVAGLLLTSSSCIVLNRETKDKR